jgi:hypothetical protein
MALTATGKVNQAEPELKLVSDAERNMPADAAFAPPVDNKTRDIMKIARDVLTAKLPWRETTPPLPSLPCAKPSRYRTR